METVELNVAIFLHLNIIKDGMREQAVKKKRERDGDNHALKLTSV